MDYQKELICIRCESKGTIRKIKLHDMFCRGDEVVYFVCTNCKTYGSMWEGVVSNAEDFPLMLEEEWEWVDDHFLDEKVDEEDMVDLTKEGKELEKELEKLPPDLRKQIAKDFLKGEEQ